MHQVASARRQDILQLPNELLHKIILWAIADGVHAICTTNSCAWEMNILVTFYCVSYPFRAITQEIACKAFDIPKSVSEEEEYELLLAMRKTFVYLHDLGVRLRHPSDWDAVRFQNMNATSSSLLMGYALYLSCISLRRNATLSTVEVFQNTHQVIFSALSQSLSLCGRVSPPQITELLQTAVSDELDLSRCGFELVQAFHELHGHANSMTILEPSSGADGSGPLAAVRSLIHSSLAKVEKTSKEYTDLLAFKSPRVRLQVSLLPGVLQSLRKLYSLRFIEDEYRLTERLHCVVHAWSGECPFLKTSHTVTP